jgi:hypothetical protein
VVKVGLAGTLGALLQQQKKQEPQQEGRASASIVTVPNFPYLLPVLPVGKHSARDGLLHIGLLVSSTEVHKNIATQLVAACAVPRAVVHVTALPPLAYLPLCAARIIVTGPLPHAQFLRELVRMDVLLYASLTECYPMLLLEGLAAGIPVVVSRTHRVLQGDAVLQQALVVEEPDSPDAVREKLVGAVRVSAVCVWGGWGAQAPRRSAMPHALLHKTLYTFALSLLHYPPSSTLTCTGCAHCRAASAPAGLCRLLAAPGRRHLGMGA